MSSVSRLAPTPSGYIHPGNAVNFLIAAALMRAVGGTLRLRIDDLDPARTNQHYLRDIFDALDVLDIEVSDSPRKLSEFDGGQRTQRTQYYRTQLNRAIRNGLPIYYCTCSRTELARRSWNSWSRHPCRDNHRHPAVAHTCRTPLTPATSATISDITGQDFPADPVLWRRDDLPGYQLASLVDDRDAEITHIVRGADLLESSLIQIYLAPFIAAKDFLSVRFVHHQLVVAHDGAKLSKSDQSQSLRAYLASQGSIATLRGIAYECLTRNEPATLR